MSCVLWQQAKIGRENNLSDFKSAYDIETMPKFGAGSEYGREQREEARKKKFGMHIKKYSSDEQPWLLNLAGAAGRPPRRSSNCFWISLFHVMQFCFVLFLLMMVIAATATVVCWV